MNGQRIVERARDEIHVGRERIGIVFRKVKDLSTKLAGAKDAMNDVFPNHLTHEVFSLVEISTYQIATYEEVEPILERKKDSEPNLSGDHPKKWVKTQELEIMSTNLKLTQINVNIVIFIYKYERMQCIHFSKVGKIYYIPIFATNAVL